MTDIIVTTPITNRELAAQEAANARANPGSFYFRTFSHRVKRLAFGSRIFYVQEGYLRGFAVVSKIREGNAVCETSGIDYGHGFHYMMPADSWKWIEPIAMEGFQGYRRFNLDESTIKIVGGWLDPQPEAPPLPEKIPLREQADLVPRRDTDGSLLLPRGLYCRRQVDDLQELQVSIEVEDGFYRLHLPSGWTTFPTKIDPDLHIFLVDKDQHARALINNSPTLKAKEGATVQWVKVTVFKTFCLKFLRDDDAGTMSVALIDRPKKEVIQPYPPAPISAGAKRQEGCRFARQKALNRNLVDALQRLQRQRH